MSDLLNLCRNRWRGILPNFGIAPKHLAGKNCPCPRCGGKDRFRFINTNGDGTWVCNQCGAGNGISLLMKLKGWDFKTVAEEIERIVGSARIEPTKPQRSERRIRDDNNRLWRSGQSITSLDPVGLYLARRCGLTAFPPCLRYVVTGAAIPTMVAMVSEVGGRAATLHRTLLTPEGHKARVSKPKLFVHGPIPKGIAVRLFPASAEMGVAEGIETALSAASLFGMPVWSALDAGHLATWAPPVGVERVVIFADNDASFTGQNSAFALARRLSTLGIGARVEIPQDVGTDWNDVLVRRSDAA